MEVKRLRILRVKKPIINKVKDKLRSLIKEDI